MRKSYRSHLTKMFREAEAICAEARATGMPIDEVTEIRAERAKKARETRREFLQTAGLAAAAVAASSFMPLRMRGQGKLGKVVIVGAASLAYAAPIGSGLNGAAPQPFTNGMTMWAGV